MKEKILELRKISKRFPGVKALDEASLNLYKGRVMALLGENGAGKSTLMRVMSGVCPKDEGEIIFSGKKIQFDSVKGSQKAGIAFIHQELNLIPNLTIAENIFLGRERASFTRIDWKRIHQECDILLKKLKVNRSTEELVENLNIGEQQMVEIAKALSQKSEIIVMDEPTDALTEQEGKNLFSIIREITGEGRSVVYISHRIKEVCEVCDDVTVMRDGKTLWEKEVEETTEEEIIEKMVGKRVEEEYPEGNPSELGEIKLEVESLQGNFLNNVSFTLKKGEILGVAGLAGSGRTELAKTIYGACRSDGGKIRIDSKNIKIKSPQDGLKNRIAYVSEDRKKEGLISGLSVKENMTLSSLGRFKNRLKEIDRDAEEKLVSSYIKRFDIKTPGIGERVKNLSGGNQQKVAIARALMTEPEILILDEPTRGVDVGGKREIYNFINELRKKGMSIMIISSELREIMGMSDRIMVMYQGSVAGILHTQQTTLENIMKYAIGIEGEE